MVSTVISLSRHHVLRNVFNINDSSVQYQLFVIEIFKTDEINSDDITVSY